MRILEILYKIKFATPADARATVRKVKNQQTICEKNTNPYGW